MEQESRQRFLDMTIREQLPLDLDNPTTVTAQQLAEMDGNVAAAKEETKRAKDMNRELNREITAHAKP